jgi:hypothetical protein
MTGGPRRRGGIAGPTTPGARSGITPADERRSMQVVRDAIATRYSDDVFQ